MSHRKKRIFFKIGAGALLSAFVCTQAGLVEVVRAWSVKTHVYSTNFVLEDALPDCTVTLPGTTISGVPFGEYHLDAETCDALQRFEGIYRSGAVDGDALPDFLVGQSIVHPGALGVKEEKNRDPLTDPRPGVFTADSWFQYLMQAARNNGRNDPRKLAYAYGQLAHASGDIFGHTWVNDLAGGVWDWEQLAVVFGHIALENYVNLRTRDLTASERDLIDSTDDSKELREHLAESFITKKGIADHTDIFHYNIFRELKRVSEKTVKTIRSVRKIKKPSGGFFDFLAAIFAFLATAPLRPALIALSFAAEPPAILWRDDVSKGIVGFIEPGQETAQSLLENRPIEIIDHYIEWAGYHGLRMFVVGRPIQAFQKVIKFLAAIGVPLVADINRLIDAEIKRVVTRMVCSYVEDKTGMTCDQWLEIFDQGKGEALLAVRFPPGWSCGDGLDNGGDGLADQQDPDCDLSNLRTYSYAGINLPLVWAFEDLNQAEGSCNDGRDNDGNGISDDDDPTCVEDRFAGNRIAGPAAPASADATITILLSLPNESRTRCGTTRPT